MEQNPINKKIYKKGDLKKKKEKKEKKRKNFGLNHLLEMSSITELKEWLVHLDFKGYINELIVYLKSDDPLILSIKTNYIFYISILICIIIISIKTGIQIVWGLITIVFISFMGYVVHFISHSFRVEELYDQLNNHNYLTRNSYFDYFIRIWCKSVDFHDIIHHDSKINKTFKNVAIEFMLNFYTQAGAFLLFALFVKNLSTPVILLWGFMYPTVHLINYEFKQSKTHVLHHKNSKTNYGIDIWDILFNTKYNGDNTEIENINHYSINVVIITFLIIIISNKMDLIKKIIF